MSTPLRPAAVAGMFYPDSPAELSREVAGMLADASARPAACPKALIAPHAGYVYSGQVAACAFALLSGWRKAIRRVILLGPTHRVAVSGLALPASEAFATPLGTIPIDRQGLAAIAGLPQVVFSDPAHRYEHSLEVELPFLQIALDGFSLLPIAVGDATPEAVCEVLDCVWGGPETLIVVSSDLSHYLPRDDARQIDRKTAQQIIALDPMINHYQACGATPVNGLLLAARRHHLEAQQVELCNSGDTAGDPSRVVGYGAFAFFAATPGVQRNDH